MHKGRLHTLPQTPHPFPSHLSLHSSFFADSAHKFSSVLHIGGTQYTHALPSDLSCWKLLHEVASVGRGPGASYLQVQPLPAVLPPTWGFSNINTAGAKQGVASFLNTAVLKVALDPALHVAAPWGLGGCFCISGIFRFAQVW